MNDALLLALGELIDKEISAAQLLRRVVEVMAESLGADRCTIFIAEPERHELVSIAAQLPEIEEIRVPISEGVAGYVARTGRVVNVPYCKDDVHFWREVDARTGYQTTTMLAGPLSDADGQIIGVVQFLNKQSGIFTDDDERRMAVLAEQVAALLGQTTLRGSSPDPDARSSASVPLGDQINRVVGSGQEMRAVYALVRKVAPTDATVLLRGESGTGKGLIARALHHNSRRHAASLIVVDCTTLPEGLMENELFGHERGAFTGADRRQHGKVHAAEGGTLFLDEIGDLPLPLQAKLLTLIQERTYHRVGGSAELSADIRIVAATNCDLEQLVADGRFRQDLYYRLRVVEIELPPLRARGEDDLKALIHHFIRASARRHRCAEPLVTDAAMGLLLGHHWPGNVRELENCIESAVIFAEGAITPSTLPLPRANATMELAATALVRPAPTSPDHLLDVADEPRLKELEKRYIAWLLARHDGNRSACSRILGIGRNTLIRKIREYDLD